MDISIGLPTQVVDLDGKILVEWAKRSEAAGFASLGTVGRLVYPNYDDLIALTAAAAVTERIRLTTSVLLAPAARQCGPPSQTNGLARPPFGRTPGARGRDRGPRRRLHRQWAADRGPKPASGRTDRRTAADSGEARNAAWMGR